MSVSTWISVLDVTSDVEGEEEEGDGVQEVVRAEADIFYTVITFSLLAVWNYYSNLV